MAFCPSCGSQVEGRFCAKCGSAVGVDPGGTVPPAPATPMQSTTVQSSGMTDNLAAALCYLLGIVTGILFLVLEPYNKNRTIRFHAFQSIFLNVAVIILAIGVGIFDSMLWHMIGFWLSSLVSLVFNLACFALWIFMIVTTYQGRTTVLPLIGPLAQQQA